MEQREIEIGRLYAVREPPRTGGEMQKVKVLERVRSGRWKVEWIDPNPGLVDYVKSANIICRWADHRAVVRDEERYERLRGISDPMWPGEEHPLTEAVGEVLASTGEDIYTVHGVLMAPPDVIERVCARSGVDPDALPDHHFSFVDRAGTQHLSFGAALHLAKAFAAAEPDIVLLHLDTSERKYVIRASEPAHGYLVPLVERWRAGWAIVRQWAGTDEQLTRKDKEIERLRQIIQRTIWDLRSAGHDDLAARVRGAYARGEPRGGLWRDVSSSQVYDPLHAVRRLVRPQAGRVGRQGRSAVRAQERGPLVRQPGGECRRLRLHEVWQVVRGASARSKLTFAPEKPSRAVTLPGERTVTQASGRPSTLATVVGCQRVPRLVERPSSLSVVAISRIETPAF